MTRGILSDFWSLWRMIFVIHVLNVHDMYKRQKIRENGIKRLQWPRTVFISHSFKISLWCAVLTAVFIIASKFMFTVMRFANSLAPFEQNVSLVIKMADQLADYNFLAWNHPYAGLFYYTVLHRNVSAIRYWHLKRWSCPLVHLSVQKWRGIRSI